MIRRAQVFIAAALAMAAPAVADAAIIGTFDNRGDFAAAVGSASISFDLGPDYLAPTYSVGGLTVAPSSAAAHIFGFGGIITTDLDQDGLVLTFADAITAIGLTGGVADETASYLGGSLLLELVGSGSSSLASSSAGPGYLGLVSDVAFTQVRISLASFDNTATSAPFVQIEQQADVSGRGTLPAVPEPATWALMIVGFGAVGGALRRRAASASTTRFA